MTRRKGRASILKENNIVDKNKSKIISKYTGMLNARQQELNELLKQKTKNEETKIRIKKLQMLVNNLQQTIEAQKRNLMMSRSY